MTKKQVIDYVMSIAKTEIGYMEKRTNSQLDSKTANAGSGNYTKYWRDIAPDYQGQPWCAGFLTWVFTQAFGKSGATKLLKHYPYINCDVPATLFKLYSNPERGDIVVFYRNGDYYHTEIVTKVVGDKFYTIGGNTSGASGVIQNGGGVCEKNYLNSQLPGTKFCRPDWSLVADVSEEGKSKPTHVENPVIADGQRHLNNFTGFHIKVDGIWGKETQKAAIQALQIALNKDYKAKLIVDGIWGVKTAAAVANVVLKRNAKSTLVTVVEILLMCKGINPSGVENPGIFGQGCENAVIWYQREHGLEVDGHAGPKTIHALVTL